MTGFELQRLAYLIRTRVAAEMLDSKAGINACVEQTAEGLTVYLRAHIMARITHTSVDAGPDGRWQMLKAVFGLPHRRKSTTVMARALFPDIPTNKERIIFRVEADDDDLSRVSER